MPGRTRAEAFKLAQEMVDAVTADNPIPVKLKFEKVFHPCVLQTKKRYVGYAYETLEQTEPIFDAKGIETVRRDTCPLVSNVCLHWLLNINVTCRFWRRRCAYCLSTMEILNLCVHMSLNNFRECWQIVLVHSNIFLRVNFVAQMDIDRVHKWRH